jgi:hypothetical protein
MNNAVFYVIFVHYLFSTFQDLIGTILVISCYFDVRYEDKPEPEPHQIFFSGRSGAKSPENDATLQNYSYIWGIQSPYPFCLFLMNLYELDAEYN